MTQRLALLNEKPEDRSVHCPEKARKSNKPSRLFEAEPKPNMSKHAARGRPFEAYLEMIFAAYAAQGRAQIEKVAPPTAMVGGPGRWRPVHLLNPFLDYTGTWTERGGRSLHLEAKSTEKHLLPVGVEGGVTAEQMAALERWQKAGAVAAVLWSHNGEVRIATHDLLALQRAEGRGSIRFADAFPVLAGVGMTTDDILATIAALDL